MNFNIINKIENFSRDIKNNVKSASNKLLKKPEHYLKIKYDKNIKVTYNKKFKLSNAFKHLCMILTHKYNVFVYCCHARLFYQGIVHDLSKFSPVEFIENALYYQGYRSPITACTEDIGFSNAFRHHVRYNKHHYKYWIIYEKRDNTYLEMPFKYALEMICDVLAASKSYNNNVLDMNKLITWWHKEQIRQGLSQAIMQFGDIIFKTIYEEKNFKVLNKKRSIYIYNYCIKKYASALVN